MDFKTLPTGSFILHNVTIPAGFLGKDGELLVTDLGIADGKIAEVNALPESPVVEMSGAMVLPAFVDMHTLTGVQTTFTSVPIFLCAAPMRTAPEQSARIWTVHQLWMKFPGLFLLHCAITGQAKLNCRRSALTGVTVPTWMAGTREPRNW